MNSDYQWRIFNTGVPWNSPHHGQRINDQDQLDHSGWRNRNKSTQSDISESDDTEEMEESYLVEIPSRIQHFEWKINNFFCVTKAKEYCIKSPIFLLMNREYTIQLVPRESFIACDLTENFQKKHTLQNINKLNFKLGIKRADGSIYQVIDNGYRISYGYSWKSVIDLRNLMRLKDILLPDGILTVVLTIQLEDDKDCALWVSWNDSSKALGEHFKNLMLSGNKSDVVIKVKDHKFQVHSMILSARSPVFSAMFQHSNMIEATNNLVEIYDCEPETFGDILLYIYTGRCDHVTATTACSLYVTADKYHLLALMEECVRCMARELSVDSFCEVISVAVTYTELELLDVATRFFIRSSEAILETEKWKQFLDNNSVFANELIIVLVKSKNETAGCSDNDKTYLDCEVIHRIMPQKQAACEKRDTENHFFRSLLKYFNVEK